MQGIKLISLLSIMAMIAIIQPIDALWMEASGAIRPIKNGLYGNIKKHRGEVGNRYGNKLAGWFFDGGTTLYGHNIF